MWAFIAAFVVVSAVVATAPKPQGVTPAGFNDVKFPTADEGRDLPVLFGTRELESPNVVWFGDFRAQAIRKKPKK